MAKCAPHAQLPSWDLFMKICALNAAAAVVLAASTFACASARADTFDFSYTFGDGGIVSGVAEGIIQSDPNSVFLYSINNLIVLGEVVAPAIVGDFIYSPPGRVTLDGSSMDLAAGLGLTSPVGFMAVTVLPPSPDAAAWAPSGSHDSEAYDPAHWSVTTTAVPEPATWVLMLAGFGAVGAFGYRTRSGARRTAA
jgi:hypothetical protein